MNMKTGRREKIYIILSTVFILSLLLCLYFASCKFITKNTDTDTGIRFRRIYDSPDTTAYTAIDIEQTSWDGGYIILGEVEEHPYLLKVDKKGNFLWDNKDKNLWDSKDKNIFEYYKYPIAELLPFNQAYYFFCGKQKDDYWDDWDLVLVKVRKEDKIKVDVVTKVEFENPFPGFKYRLTPIHANLNSENNYIFLTATNWGDTRPFIGTGNNKNNWNINHARHWNRYECAIDYPSADKRAHYTGKLKEKGTYYFQTFSKYLADNNPDPCFSIRMEAPDGGKIKHPDLWISRPFIAMEWNDSQWDVRNWDGDQWEGLKLSCATIDNDMVYFTVNSQIKVEKKKEIIKKEIEEEIEISIMKLEEGEPQPELLASKSVYMKTMTVNGKDIVFFCGTKGEKIILFAYDLVESKLLGKKYFGGTRLYETSDLINTDDEGLAILGITFIMDRFKRICLFKLSKKEVEEMCQQ